MKPEEIDTTTAEKAEAVLKAMVNVCNQSEGAYVRLEQDWAENNLTVEYGDTEKEIGSHTHIPSAMEPVSWEELVEALYASIIEGHGLSWHCEAKQG